MKCKCCKNDTDRYATNLRREAQSPNLIWDSARGQDVLIVQTSYGQDAATKMDELREALDQKWAALNTTDQLPKQFTEVLTGVWVCYVSAADKVRNNGCRLHGEASTYTVMSCFLDGETLCIYLPPVVQDLTQAMISPICNIPLNVNVTVERETVEVRRWFRTRVEETGFYCVSFGEKVEDSYRDGNMIYQIGEFKIPVTRDMIKQRTVYIKSEVRPKFSETSKGLHVDQTDI